MTDAVPYTVPKQPGAIRAFLLALAMHGSLLIMLVIGVNWKSEAPAVVEAEVWDLQVREAAPVPEPVPEPEPVPPPKPVEPAPEPVEPPKPKVEEPPAKDPEIALEQEKKRKKDEERKRRLEEAERKREEEKQKRLEQERLALQKKLQEEKRLAAEQSKKEAEEKKRLEQQKAEQLVAERRRKEELARLMSQAGNGGSGNAAKSQGGRADASYVSKLSAKIKSNTVFVTPPDLDGNPAVEYRVELLPDGSIRSIRKMQPSGVPGFDEAVERAIRRSEPFPADNTGTVPSGFVFLHRPKDNN